MKKPLVISAVCGALIVAGCMAISQRDSLRSSTRRAWKDTRIAEISARAADPAWVSREMEGIKAKMAADPGDSDGWFSDELILMQNGDWLAYASVCRKEDSRIHDLFLARGSDGQWYFSTYHFCKGMLVLRVEDQSENLPAFVKAYYLRPFDGQSDECLQKTWPPESM